VLSATAFETFSAVADSAKIFFTQSLTALKMFYYRRRQSLKIVCAVADNDYKNIFIKPNKNHF
jgi:hypothetical protein